MATPNNLPIPAVAVMASAPQNVTRKTARPTGAPPAQADRKPSSVPWTPTREITMSPAMLKRRSVHSSGRLFVVVGPVFVARGNNPIDFADRWTPGDF